MAPALRQVQWPHKFKAEMPPCYNGATDPLVFLLAYEEAVLKARGDDKVMANWLPMALTGVPRMWLLHLPTASMASWGSCAASSSPSTLHRRTRSSQLS